MTVFDIVPVRLCYDCWLRLLSVSCALGAVCMLSFSPSSFSPFSFYAISSIYIKPREHGDCMFRNEWLHRFNYKPWPEPWHLGILAWESLGRWLGTLVLCLGLGVTGTLVGDPGPLPWPGSHWDVGWGPWSFALAWESLGRWLGTLVLCLGITMSNKSTGSHSAPRL